jgi:hypothetical protein
VLQGGVHLLFVDIEILTKFGDDRLDVCDGDLGDYIQGAGVRTRPCTELAPAPPIM